MQKTFYMYKISNLLNISEIVTIHYQKLSKTYSYPSESHDFWEIIYCDKNEMFVIADGVTHTLKKAKLSLSRLIKNTRCARTDFPIRIYLS